MVTIPYKMQELFILKNDFKILVLLSKILIKIQIALFNNIDLNSALLLLFTQTIYSF